MRAILTLLIAALAPPAAAANSSIQPAVQIEPPTRIEVIAANLRHPWSFAFLPGGAVLVTERSGTLKRIEAGRVTPVTGVPPVLTGGQAGLFDIALHPDFARNQLIYLSLAHGTKAANATRIVRARLAGHALTDVTPLYTATPMKSGPVHFGARMAFLPDQTLLLTTGDGFDWRESAQKLESPLGKVMRLTADGKVPADNPFISSATARSTIFSYGHRNPQGLAYDPVRRLIFSHEHGPKGGDEINILTPGANYGWPIATYGMDYSGATISPFTAYKGTTQPLLHWTPSIAPSGLAIYYGAMFPEWQGDLLVGALVNKEVRRIHLSADGRKVLSQHPMFREAGARIRDIRIAPDGAIWLITDEEKGQVLRVTRR